MLALNYKLTLNYKKGLRIPESPRKTIRQLLCELSDGASPKSVP